MENQCVGPPVSLEEKPGLLLPLPEPEISTWVRTDNEGHTYYYGAIVVPGPLMKTMSMAKRLLGPDGCYVKDWSSKTGTYVTILGSNPYIPEDHVYKGNRTGPLRAVISTQLGTHAVQRCHELIRDHLWQIWLQSGAFQPVVQQPTSNQLGTTAAFNGPPAFIGESLEGQNTGNLGNTAVAGAEPVFLGSGVQGQVIGDCSVPHHVAQGTENIFDNAPVVDFSSSTAPYVAGVDFAADRTADGDHQLMPDPVITACRTVEQLGRRMYSGEVYVPDELMRRKPILSYLTGVNGSFLKYWMSATGASVKILGSNPHFAADHVSRDTDIDGPLRASIVSDTTPAAVEHCQSLVIEHLRRCWATMGPAVVKPEVRTCMEMDLFALSVAQFSDKIVNGVPEFCSLPVMPEYPRLNLAVGKLLDGAVHLVSIGYDLTQTIPKFHEPLQGSAALEFLERVAVKGLEKKIQLWKAKERFELCNES